MSVKPILFNGMMVRAILDGRKTVTRRVVRGAWPDWSYLGLTDDAAVTAVDRYGEEYPKPVDGLWAEFECKGPLPNSLQSVNTQIWSEWLPTLKGYSLAGNYSIEMYCPPAEKPEDTLSSIWIPLKKD